MRERERERESERERARDRDREEKNSVSQLGRSAQTKWKIIKQNNDNIDDWK